MGPLTALHIAPTPFFADRGAHVRIRGIVLALNKKALRNIVCTYHHGREIDGIETVRIPQIPGYTKQEAGPSAFKYVADLLLFVKALQVVRKVRPDVIHGHLHEGALVGWAVKTCFFWRKMPLLFDVQGSLVGELASHGYFRKGGLLRRLFYCLEKLIVRLPDHFLCSSVNSIELLRREFDVLPDRISLASDGVDVYRTDPGAASSLRARLALPHDRPVIIYTGGLSRAKGLDVLCEIILETAARSLRCHFLIAGYPEQIIEDFTKKNNLDELCTVVGRVPYEQLREFLSLADIGVEPKIADSSEASGKLLNYMGSGLPVVCFDTRKNRSILGQSGCYVRRGSVRDFVDAIQMIVEAPKEARRRGFAGRARVLDKFSWDATADKIYSTYQASLSQRAGPGTR